MGASEYIFCSYILEKLLRMHDLIFTENIEVKLQYTNFLTKILQKYVPFLTILE